MPVPVSKTICLLPAILETANCTQAFEIFSGTLRPATRDKELFLQATGGTILPKSAVGAQHRHSFASYICKYLMKVRVMIEKSRRSNSPGFRI
ncbi:hypothetical protein ABZ820_36920 [Streptomyces diacarni]|uniref:hypothetical protein n=1 Tax=Streptomyces diacarni TaxID=2800381 RepID=UPI0033CEE4AB